jgi:hypothetical protein
MRKGPLPFPARDGDKAQALQRINVEVRTGRRPHPNTLPCVDCDHVWTENERRHEYDHHKGYAAEHHLDVKPVCTTCHAIRDSARKAQTSCIHGHEFTTENTIIAANGTRHCRECFRIYDRGRRDAKWWRDYRAKKREKKYG